MVKLPEGEGSEGDPRGRDAGLLLFGEAPGMEQSDPFYRSARWRKARAERLEMDHYMCARCMKLYEAGLLRKPRRAEVVHHIRPYREAPELALVLENLESLCSWHHNEEHPEKGIRPEKRRARDPGMRVIKV